MDEDIYDLLYATSDISEQEYTKIKTQHCGKDQIILRALLSRSTIPELRNLHCPPGEIYAPLAYTADYMIKLVKKPSWGGYIVTILLWDLLVIDIDVDAEDTNALSNIINNIMHYYPDELFYINKTIRGYHLYMVSNLVEHNSKYAIYSRIKLESDPAHGSNSMYTGSSIRLSRKNTDIADHAISKYYTSAGNGKLCVKAVELYNIVQCMIAKFGDLQIDIENQSHLQEMYSLWKNHTPDFGNVHITCTAPMTLNKQQDKVYLKFNPSFSERSDYFDDILHRYWSAFIKYRVLREERLSYLLLMCQHNMCYNNLYRILESTEDYAIGVHLQQNCHFISYRDLLCVDYDHARLGIVYRYVKRNPEATFRIVRTNKGYHVFLTSYPINHRYGINLLILLCSDPCHIVGVYHRGYSIRVNKKYVDERPYKEIAKVGKAPENQHLLELYYKHFELYDKNNKTKLMQCQITDSEKVLKDSIMLNIQ